MTTPLLSVKNVSRVHRASGVPVPALSAVSLDVEAGELVAVMGPSGSGKSTLLNIAGGLDRPDEGAVAIDGADLSGLDAAGLAKIRRQRVGLVFQDYNLIRSLTAVENVALPLELDGRATRSARIEAAAALRDVDLEGLDQRFPGELSGGQQQRVAIARALVGDRRLVLADEPTGALDSTTGEQILALLRRQCDTGAAVLLVTHDSRQAGWADRIVFLKDGRVASSSAPPELTESLLKEPT